MRRIVLLLLAGVCTLATAGQQRYSIRHYGNADGLPSNAIKGMEWDADNDLLWIGTEGGLLRWDGSNFDAAAINAGRVMGMGAIKGAPRRLYAWCENDSIYVIERGRIHAIRGRRDPIQVQHPNVTDSTALFADLGRETATMIWPEWLLPVGPSSNLFLYFYKQKLYLKEGRSARLLRDHLAFAQLVRNGAQVFINSSDGLWVVDAQTKALERIHVTGIGSGPLALLPNSDGQPPLLHQGRNLYRLVPGEGRLSWKAELLTDALPPEAKPYLARTLSAFGLIVLGDRISGLYVLHPKTIRQLTDSTGRISNEQLVTYGQALLPDGRVLSHSGVIYDRNGPVIGTTLPVGGSPYLFRFGNYLYFPQNGNLFRYSIVTQTSEQFMLMDSSGWGTLVVSGGTLYVVGGFRLSRLNSDTLEPLYRFPEEKDKRLMQNSVATEWAPGKLLIGSANFLRLLDIATLNLHNVRVSRNAPIRHFWRTPYGAFICTYGEGIFLYQNDSVYALPMDKSGYLRFAHAIVSDGHGFCYISTNNGLFKVSEKALRDAAATGAPVYYHLLGREDGLAQTELNGGGLPPYLRLPDGTLSFPTMSGLAQLHPDSATAPRPSGVILLQASVDGTPQDSLPARFAADVKLFRFDVTIPFWGANENLYAWYRLRRRGEKADERTWILFNPAMQRHIDFSALQSDQYEFEVRTFNGFNAGDFTVRSYRFEVAPPWYASGRYLLLWLVLLVALVWLLVYLRTRQLRARSLQLEATVRHRTGEIEQQKQQLGQQLQLVSEAHDLKERLISVISHNIITPLRYIHRATTMMRDDARSLDPALREKAVDSINDTSLELELLAVNLLNWIKLQHKEMTVAPELFTFSGIAEHVKGLLGPVAKSCGQTIVVEDACTTPIYQFKDALQVILYNLVLNAITHSGGTQATLSCRHDAGGFTVCVDDNGRGIPEPVREQLLGGSSRSLLKETENQGKGFGFIIIRDLVRYIGGTLRVDPASPGTRISVQFRDWPHPDSGQQRPSV